MRAFLRQAKSGRKEIDRGGVLRYEWRLESMAFRHSYSAAGLALLWGSCASCLLAPWAGAGDKIEFSSPAISWGVPQREVEVKDNKTSASPAHSSAYPNSFYPGLQQTTVIITAPRGTDKHTWDSSLTGDQGRKDLSSFERLFPQDGSSGLTNSPGRPTGWNSDSPSGLAPRRSQDAVETSDGLTSRAFGRDDSRNQERLRDRFYESGGGFPWSRDSDTHGAMALDRMQHGEFVRFGDYVRSSYEQQSVSSSAGGLRGGMDPLHSSSLPPSLSGYSYSLSAGSFSGGREGDVFGTPGMAPAWDSRAISRPAARNNSSLDQPWSAGGQKQAPPAVLPFPRKPGDLFQ
jgi:hypothetical protein